MGSFSIWHWIIVLVLLMLLFGTGKISNVMGEFAKGIKAFKKGLNEDEGSHGGSLPEGAEQAPNAQILSKVDRATTT